MVEPTGRSSTIHGAQQYTAKRIDGGGASGTPHLPAASRPSLRLPRLRGKVIQAGRVFGPPTARSPPIPAGRTPRRRPGGATSQHSGAHARANLSSNRVPTCRCGPITCRFTCIHALMEDSRGAREKRFTGGMDISVSEPFPDWAWPGACGADPRIRGPDVRRQLPPGRRFLNSLSTARARHLAGRSWGVWRGFLEVLCLPRRPAFRVA